MKSIFAPKVALIAGLTLCLAPLSAHARGTLTFDQAVQVCTERAIEFGRKPYGRYADEPPQHKVQDDYRACVYSNSGQYPVAKVKYRESILTLLRDAF